MMEFEIIEINGTLRKVSTLQGGSEMGTGTTERPSMTENITVFQVGEYGVRVGEKTWFGVNKPLTPSSFVPDTSYKVTVTVSKTGKKYINSIVGTEDKAASTEATSAPTTAVSDDVKAAEAALAKAKAEAVAKAAAAAATAAPKTSGVAASGAPYRAGYDKPLSQYDLAKDRQISRAGIYQAALQSTSLAQWATGPDEFLALVRKAADEGMKYIQE